MKQTRIMMGMPITVEVLGGQPAGHIGDVYEYFESVDERYSPFKLTSEVSQINAGLAPSEWSEEMKRVIELCEETRLLTDGYFNVTRGGVFDPSGLVKGWAIFNAAELLREEGIKDFYIEAGGDIQASGVNPDGKPWLVGIRNPFNMHEIVKVLEIGSEGVATSGSYVRGAHVYNPITDQSVTGPVVSLTVVGSNIYDADRFATAAYAMGEQGINFIEATPGLEGYAIDVDGIATYTKGFQKYAQEN